MLESFRIGSKSNVGANKVEGDENWVYIKSSETENSPVHQGRDGSTRGTIWRNVEVLFLILAIL